jgi:hypothetical protein
MTEAMQPFPPPEFWRALLEVRWRIVAPYCKKRPLLSRVFAKRGSLWDAVDVIEEYLQAAIDHRWHDDGNT